MRVTDSGALLEREGELREVDRAVEQACAGAGRLILVEGPAGIGKTRLLEATRAHARAQGMAVHSARASELDRSFPFGVVRQLFEPLLAGPRREDLLRGAAAPADRLLTGTPLDFGPRRSLEHFHALYWLASNLAEEAPAALVVDDVHWADSGSLRFLEFLVPRLEGLPILLAIATRPAEPGADQRVIDALATDPLAVLVRPAPLSAGAVAELVEAELGEAADPRFCAACREACGGNPFLLRELLRELAAERVVPDAASAPLVGQLAPPTVARAVLLRLARLGGEAAALARAVAVLGDGTPLRRACALAALDEERGAEVAGDLAAAGILSPGRPLAFAHPVLRSAVYHDLDAGERAAAHRRAAALLAEDGADPGAVAVHLLETEPRADPEVVAALREAAARAISRGAAAVGVACLRRALEEPPPPDDRGVLTLRLAVAELFAGEPDVAAEHFAAGARVTADARSRALYAWDHAAALNALGRSDEAWRVRMRAIEEAAEIDGELSMSLEASLVASAALDVARLGWARDRLDRHRGRLTGATPADRRLLATQAIVDAMFGDEPAEAVAAVAERALAAGDLAEETSGFVPFFCAIEALWLADRVDSAHRALDRALEAMRRRGSVLGFAAMSGWRSMLIARQGQLTDAEAEARSCAELSLEHGWFGVAPPMLGYVLDVLIARGETDDARRLLAASGLGDRAAADDLTFHPMVHARARLRAAAGDVAGGREDFAVLVRRRDRWNTYMPLVPALLVAPELAGEPDEERERAERMLQEARGWGTARAVGMALRTLGLATGDLDLLREAAGLLEDSPARLEHAAALADLGAALRRANHRADAREPLRQALDLAEACGAPPLVERTRHELRAAGGRPRRPRISGADALTASERHTAAMAADGLSNPEIAQALFVTKKTVEAHLGNAYRKLGIRSRTELAEALRAR
ncbi:MAG TPA: AAA family ATPase [Thermoleophilaceae bacterium]